MRRPASFPRRSLSFSTNFRGTFLRHAFPACDARCRGLLPFNLFLVLSAGLRASFLSLLASGRHTKLQTIAFYYLHSNLFLLFHWNEPSPILSPDLPSLQAYGAVFLKTLHVTLFPAWLRWLCGIPSRMPVAQFSPQPLDPCQAQAYSRSLNVISGPSD